jgi:hypothetical protein
MKTWLQKATAMSQDGKVSDVIFYHHSRRLDSANDGDREHLAAVRAAANREYGNATLVAEPNLAAFIGGEVFVVDPSGETTRIEKFNFQRPERPRWKRATTCFNPPTIKK